MEGVNLETVNGTEINNINYELNENLSPGNK